MSTLREITYSTVETSELTGASQKQIRYWISRGYVFDVEMNVCGDISYYRFSQNHIEIIRAIKGFLDQGYILARAAELALTTKQSH